MVKQKNLILLVVAVGCGLLAAFLTTQMSAKPASVEQADVYVAVKEIKVGDKIEKDKISDLITKKKMARADAPIDSVASEEELYGKMFNNSRQAGDVIRTGDVGKFTIVTPPEGKYLYTIRLPYEAVVGPFIQPGSRVDVVATHKAPGTVEIRHFKMLPEVLVIAVDQKAQKTGETTNQVLNVLTLATDDSESAWLQLAQDAGASMRFWVRDDKSPRFTRPTEEEFLAFLNNTNRFVKKGETTTVDATPKPVTPEASPEKPIAPPVKIPIAVKEIKAGTTIDDEFLANAMLKNPFASPAPADAILDLLPHKGRVITQDIPMKAYLTEAVLGDKPKTVDTKTVETPKVVETPKPEGKKIAKTWETTITTGSGIKKYRYVMYMGDNDWTLLGEVMDDGSLNNGSLPALQKNETPKGDTAEGGKISQP